jgi:hypothetical protein
VTIEDRLNILLEAVEGLGIDVRREALGGGGGLCTLRGRRVLFLDTAGDPLISYETTLAAVCTLTGLDTVHLPPALREDLDRARSESPPGT